MRETLSIRLLLAIVEMAVIMQRCRQSAGKILISNELK